MSKVAAIEVLAAAALIVAAAAIPPIVAPQPPGEIIVKWRGKPQFVRNPTPPPTPH